MKLLAGRITGIWSAGCICRSEKIAVLDLDLEGVSQTNRILHRSNSNNDCGCFSDLRESSCNKFVRME